MSRETLTIPFTSFLDLYTGVPKPTDIFSVEMVFSSDEILNLEIAWSPVEENGHTQTLYWRQTGKDPDDWGEVVIDTTWLSAVVYI